MCEKVQLEPRRLARKREKWTTNWAPRSTSSTTNAANDDKKPNLNVSNHQTSKYQEPIETRLCNYKQISSTTPASAEPYGSGAVGQISSSTSSLHVVQDSNRMHRTTLSQTDTHQNINPCKEEVKSMIQKPNRKPRIARFKMDDGCTKTSLELLQCWHNKSAARSSRMQNTRLGSFGYFPIVIMLAILTIGNNPKFFPIYELVDGSLIMGDSAIEIQEVDQHGGQRPTELDMNNSNQLNNIASSGGSDIGGGGGGGNNGDNSLVLGKASGGDASQQSNSILSQADSLLSNKDQSNGRISPPILSPSTNNDASSSSDGPPESVRDVMSAGKSDMDSGGGGSPDDDRAISGRVVDFELTPAGGHNKAKIKKKKKKEKKMAAKEEKKFKKWSKKKKAEKKFKEMKHKEEMKKKKQEGKKAKKKWGKEVHGQKKKGDFKKKKWGKKVKKGKGVKKGKKGKKFLADKGHKQTGFKTVYHKEEWGGSKKWHDIKREKKWDEQSKKWKKKWKKEKGKKYKGDHMKKYEKQKKHGKKYKKEKKEKFKKEKKEEFKKGMKKKKEEHMKKKEGGKKKEMKEEKKKKEMKKKKKKKGRK